MAETDHLLTAVQLTKSHKNPYPWPGVRVLRGTGAGCPGKPQGCPRQSLVLRPQHRDPRELTLAAARYLLPIALVPSMFRLLTLTLCLLYIIIILPLNIPPNYTHILTPTQNFQSHLPLPSASQSHVPSLRCTPSVPVPDNLHIAHAPSSPFIDQQNNVNSCNSQCIQSLSPIALHEPQPLHNLHLGHVTSADHPQVGPRYLTKNTCRSCTCKSRSDYSHGSWWIRVMILDFCRYLQVPDTTCQFVIKY